jgi:hypothetical protein
MSEDFEVSLNFSGVFFILGESGVALIGPGFVEFSESSRFSGVHLSGSFVVSNDRVIVLNVSFKYTLSRDGVVSLRGKASKLSGPSGDSRVL